MSQVVKTSLAEQINAEHRACEAALKSGLAHALKAGELLIEAKSHSNHGEWGRWLAENFEGSVRTAQAYMKVVRELPNLEAGANAQRVAHLSFRSAMRKLASSVGGDKEEDAVAAELLELRERLEEATTLPEFVELYKRSSELRHRKAEESVRTLREGGQILLQLDKEENQELVRAVMRRSLHDLRPHPELADWRALANIPDDLFERKVAAFRRNPFGEELTVGAMIKYAWKLQANRKQASR